MPPVEGQGQVRSQSSCRIGGELEPSDGYVVNWYGPNVRLICFKLGSRGLEVMKCPLVDMW